MRLGGGGSDAAAAQLTQESIVAQEPARLARLARRVRLGQVRVGSFLGLLESGELDLG
jgi:multidrug efflux pump subunit AcrA (membrane-fusion protein)